MNNDPIARGSHIKQLRKSRKMTLKAMADATGLSVGFLSKIENGDGNPSINNIQKICSCLGITINELLDPEAEKVEPVGRTVLNACPTDKSSYILRNDERSMLYDFSGIIRLESAFSENPHFKMDVLTVTGDTSKFFTSMHQYDEVGIVARGSLRVTLNNTDEYILQEGDTIVIRAQTPHALSSAVKGETCVSHWIEINH